MQYYVTLMLEYHAKNEYELVIVIVVKTQTTPFQKEHQFI